MYVYKLKKMIGNWFCATICKKEIYCFKFCECLNWNSIFLILKNPTLIGLIKFIGIQKYDSFNDRYKTKDIN